MSNGKVPAERATGRLLVVVIAIVVLLLLIIIGWQTRTTPTEPPAPLHKHPAGQIELRKTPCA